MNKTTTAFGFEKGNRVLDSKDGRKTRGSALALALGSLVLGLCVVVSWSGVALAQPGTTRGYDYDKASNRISATQQIRFTAESAFNLFPPRAVPGDRVNIYGRNFSPSTPGSYTVTFAGAPGTIVSVAPRVITVIIPAVVGDGAVVVTLPDSTEVEVGMLTVQGVVITPGSVDLDYGDTFQFSADVFGAATTEVIWELEAVVGGAAPGVISDSGLYMAPSASGGGAFPVLVKATNVELGQIAYAVVRGNCADTVPITIAQLVSGNFSTFDERDCYDFVGVAGQVVTASYLGGSSTARRFRILDADGFPLASAGGSNELTISAAIIPSNGDYRIEVEGDSSASGAYQVWLDLLPDTAPGRWIYPGDGLWHEGNKWSGGVVPTPADTVVIPEYPGEITVTVSQGMQSCASIASAEGLYLQAGTLTVAGTVQVSAPFTLAGGALAGATIVPGAGRETPIVGASSSTLSGVTLSGANLTIPTGLSLNATNGLTIDNATVTLGSSGAGNSFLFLNGVQTIDGNGEILFSDSGSHYLYLQGGTALLTLGAGINVHGGGGYLYAFGSQSFVNQGTIAADVADRFIEARNVVNQGTLSATGGSTLSLEGVWSNAGTIAMTDSTVNLGGDFTITTLGSFVRSGGSVNVTGSLILGGETLTLDATSGSWNLVNGTLAGGTLVTADGQSLVAANSGILDTMTLSGEGITIPNNASITTVGGLTLNTSLALGSGGTGGAYLYASGTQSYAGSGEILFNESTSGLHYLYILGATTELTLGPGINVHGADGYFFAFNSQSIVNQGTIAADVSGRTVRVRNVNNQGLMDATGGSTLSLEGDWSNAGTFTMTDSTVELGGNFTVTGLGSFMRSGGAVNLTGTLDLTGEALTLDAASGSWNFVSGTVIGGTIVTADGQNLTAANSGTLTGVTIAGEGITIPSSTSITTTDGLTLNAPIVLGTGAGGSSYLYANGDQTYDGTGEIIFVDSPSGANYLYVLGSTAALTLGPGINAQGADGNFFAFGDQSVVNQGTITADVPGQSIQVRNVTNQGVMGATGGGILTILGTWSNAGTIAMTNSTVNLGGEFTISGLGTFTRSGGTVNLSGDLDLGGGTLTLDAATGSWNMVNGSIAGGTLVTADGQNLAAMNAGTLDGMTLAGEGITIPSGAFLTTTGGLTIDGALALGTGTSGNSYLYANGNQTIGGTGEILFNESTSGTRYIWLQGTDTVVTIGAGLTVHGADGFFFAGSNQGYINQGTITADVAGQVVQVRNVDNQGSLEATDDGILTLDGTWSNDGTIAMTDASVNLGGEFTITSLAMFMRSGGTVSLTGILDLEGGNLTLDATTGSWNIANGTLAGGTLVTADGQNLTATTTGTLDGMTLSGDGITIPSGASLITRGGLTVDSTLALGTGGGGHSYLYAPESQTIDGTGDILFNDSASWTRYLWLQGTDTLVTLGPALTVHGADGRFFASGIQGFVNQGTIAADVAGQTLEIHNVENQGSLEATGDGILTIEGSWSNSGTIAMTDATVNLGGDFTLGTLGTLTRSGGSINLTGTLLLGGGTLTLDATTGSWNAAGGTLAGGTLVTADGQNFASVSFGELDGMTISGEGLTIPSGTSLTSTNGLSLAADLTLGTGGAGHAILYADGTQTIDGTGEILLTDSTSWSRYLWLQGAATVLTVGPGITVRGADGLFLANSAQLVVNQGTVRSEVSGQSIQLQNFENQGLVEATNSGNLLLTSTWSQTGAVSVGSGSLLSRNGDYVQTAGNTQLDSGSTFTLNSGTLVVQGGSLTGAGVINGPLENQAEVAPSPTSGTLTINGDYSQTSSAILLLDMTGTGTGQFDRLAVSGTATLAGGVEASFSGFTPLVGDTFTFLTYGSVSGGFISATATGLGPMQDVTVNYPSGEGVLEVVVSP